MEPLGQRGWGGAQPRGDVGRGNQEPAGVRSPTIRVSDLVMQLEKQREQQQVKGAVVGVIQGRQEDQQQGVVVGENQTEWNWELVEERRGFKSKRGDRSMSASPTLVKKIRTTTLKDWSRQAG